MFRRSRATQRRLIVGAVFLGMLGLGATEAEPVLIDRVGVWNLNRLGSRTIVLTQVDRLEKRDVSYRLPRAADQGKPLWYLIRLDMELRVRSGTGTVYASALHNGAASAQVKFEVRAPGDRIEIERSSTDLINGSIRALVRSRVVRVRYRNFLPYAAVRPGLNTLTFQLERIGSVAIEEVRIASTSGIAVSRFGPARLSLRATTFPRRTVTIGDPFKVAVTLKNVGGRPTRYAAIGLEYARDEIRAATPTNVRVGPLRPGQSVSRGFVLSARTPGRIYIVFSASTSSNRPAVGVVIRAKSP